MLSILHFRIMTPATLWNQKNDWKATVIIRVREGVPWTRVEIWYSRRVAAASGVYFKGVLVRLPDGLNARCEKT